MTTGKPFDEGFDELTRAVFRPGPNPSPSGQLRVANLYSGDGFIAQVAVEAGMEVSYAHDPGARSRTRTAYEKKIGLVVNDAELPNFAHIPAFDLVLAELPKGKVDEALAFVMRFLRVRRPATFVLVGPLETNEHALVTLVREQVKELRYEVAAGADTLLGVYEPNVRDTPIAIGLLHLDPVYIPALSSEESVTEKRPVMLRTVLERIALAFPPPTSGRFRRES